MKDKVILVVDDNADNRILLTEMLFEWKMKPIVCASALEALRMVMSNRYNFSMGLIDICMPGVTGSELAKQIKEERPFFPLIALSSIDTFVTTQEFEKKLDKPINRIQLFNSIYHVLSKKQVPSAFIGDEENIETEHLSTSLSNFNKNIRILIAEDIIYNRNMLENMLENLSYTHIESAENGKIAIEMMENANNEGKPYEILLLDLRMPILDGYGVIQSIKEKGWNLPKIIVVSACVMDEDRYLCKTIGVKYFINKPIAMSQLKDVMLHATELL
jgi:CheY-like chemotaxis protein